jgi:hypothetical protein
MDFDISFVSAPEQLVKEADEILRSKIIASTSLVADIRAVAKGYIDEADELNRSVKEIRTKAEVIQIQSISPQHIIQKAKRVLSARLGDAEMHRKVHAVAESYLQLAEENHRLYKEFMVKYREHLPPTK